MFLGYRTHNRKRDGVITAENQEAREFRHLLCDKVFDSLPRIEREVRQVAAIDEYGADVQSILGALVRTFAGEGAPDGRGTFSGTAHKRRFLVVRNSNQPDLFFRDTHALRETVVAPSRDEFSYRIFFPNADSASSTAKSAVRLCSSITGFTSTISKLSMRPWSAMISMARCASRYVAPPRTGVPTPGASSGSIQSMSSEMWYPAVPRPARRRASSITVRMPRSSMSRMVKTPMPARRTFSFSMASMSRTPTSTQFSGFTFGEKSRIFASSLGPNPTSAASGMPWTLPLGDVSGVLMSV